MAITAQAVKELRDKTGAGMMDCKKALAESGGAVEEAIEKLRERGLAKAVKRAGRETAEGTIAIALTGNIGAMVELACETDFVAKTPEYLALAQSLAEVLTANPTVTSPEEFMELEDSGFKVSEAISSAAGKMGENIVVKRLARVDVAGGGLCGGYVHAGGKLGVLVGMSTTEIKADISALAKDLAMHVAAHDPSPVAIEKEGVPGQVIERERELFRRQALEEGKPEKVVERIVDGRINKYFTEVCLMEQAFVKDPDRKVRDLLNEETVQNEGGMVRVTEFVRFKLGESSSQ